MILTKALVQSWGICPKWCTPEMEAELDIIYAGGWDHVDFINDTRGVFNVRSSMFDALWTITREVVLGRSDLHSFIADILGRVPANERAINSGVIVQELRDQASAVGQPLPARKELFFAAQADFADVWNARSNPLGTDNPRLVDTPRYMVRKAAEVLITTDDPDNGIWDQHLAAIQVVTAMGEWRGDGQNLGDPHVEYDWMMGRLVAITGGP